MMIEQEPLLKLCAHDAGATCVCIEHEGYEEYFITIRRRIGEPVEAVLSRAAVLEQEYDLRIISREVLGLTERDFEYGGAVSVAGPTLWIHRKEGASAELGGIQLWAVSGERAHISPVKVGGVVIGTLFDTGSLRFCRMAGITPENVDASPDAQVHEVFQTMEDGLAQLGMSLQHVARTWFYNTNILDWYHAFNRARDDVFRAHKIYDGLVPASTGIEGSSAPGSALAAGVLAVASSVGAAAIPIPSPLQCPALEYGSSFSRAVEVSADGLRRLYISGTASIEPEGETIFQGDVHEQIAYTLKVVEAILVSRDLHWSDTTRAIAYFKHPQHVQKFETYWAQEGFPTIPVLNMHADVCRDDLLFELELDAVGKEG